jgi:hypothetical protein
MMPDNTSTVAWLLESHALVALKGKKRGEERNRGWLGGK